jgi:hypothetical protein
MKSSYAFPSKKTKQKKKKKNKKPKKLLTAEFLIALVSEGEIIMLFLFIIEP